jgi:hypothetical protein
MDMRWFRKFWVVLVFLLVVLPKQGYSEEKDSIVIVEIKNGINYFDIDNDGIKDLIISADFLTPIGGNIYTAYSFYRKGKTHFSYIPIEVVDGKGAEANIYTYAKVGGCGSKLNKEERTNISGLRLAKFKGNTYLVYGKKLCDPNADPFIEFTGKCLLSIIIYQYDDEDKTFVIKKKLQTKEKYCDINEVLKKDLIIKFIKEVK